LIKVATAESVYGPGWWRDIRSLDLGPFDQLQKTAWQGFWNEKIVKEARQCINDLNTMTIVLTGRRYHPFHQLVPAMLESKGLLFDLVGLRPDPESVSDNHWEATNNEVSYNLTNSVFKSTMHFKTCFILNILHNIPTINNVVMWDDRFHHVKRFREYLGLVKQTGTINQGSVIYVPGIRPKYNPAWEKNVIGHIIKTHNRALLEHVKEGKKNGKMNQRLEWPCKLEDPLASGSQHLLQLTSLPAQTVIALSQDCIDQLRCAYQSIYNTQLNQNKRSKWKSFGGEEPMFFGDSIYISQNVIPSANIPFGPVGTDVNIKITGYSRSPKLSCLLLQVQIDDDWENEYLLPLWFKPSEYHDIFKLKGKDVHWKFVRSNDRHMITSVTGKVNYAYRLGVQEITLVGSKRHSSSSSDDEISPPTTRLRFQN
jgi:hypothetical protein